MRKLVLMVLSASVLFAGADIEPIVDYEVQDVVKAKVEEVKQVVPVPVPVPVVQPVPVPVVIPEKNWYVGLDVLCGRFETSSGACYCIGNIAGKVGYDFNKYFGIEGRLGFGVSDKEHDNGGTSEMKENYGIYLKPQLPLGESASIFALAGYAKAKVESANDGVATGLTGEINEGSPSFGLGIEYKINDTWSVLAEGIRLLHEVDGDYINGSNNPVKEEDINLDTYGFGINYRF